MVNVVYCNDSNIVTIQKDENTTFIHNWILKTLRCW